MGAGGRKSPANAFENEGADAEAFESEADRAAFDNPLGPTVSSVLSDDGSVFDDDGLKKGQTVMPESLDAQEDSPQTEAWKLSLVGHATDRKENARDRQRRKAVEALEGSSIINPEGAFRRKWDLAQMLLLVYVGFGVPYRLGFSHPVRIWTGWFWFDACVDIYFLCDIVISCVTAYYDAGGTLVVNPKLIRQRYLRTWCLIDVSSCFPGNYISYALDDGSGNSSSSRSIKLLRMLRLLKLLRLARINRLIKKYEEEFASLMTTFKLAKLIVVIIVVGHWLSCMFFYVGSIDDADITDPGLDETGERNIGWVARQFHAEDCGQGLCLWQKYVTSFYWAVMTMTTVGYGDIVPATKYEMIACIISMIIGGFVFGMIVGNLAELSKRANAGELMRQEAVSRVKMILESGVATNAVPTALSRRIKAQCSYQLERKTALDINAFILNLPPDMRDAMAESMHWIDGAADGHEVFGLLHKIPFLMKMSNQATIRICAKMKNMLLTPAPGQSEIIMQEGAPSEEMYVIIEGSRSVLLEAASVQLGRLSAGDFFGELGALLPPEMSDLRLRRRSAFATSPTQLGMITYDDLMQFRRDSMEINERVVSYTNQILAHLPASSPVSSEADADGKEQRRTLSVLDPHPELKALEQKMDQILLNQQARGVSPA
jgi:hypothetical protein